MIFRDPSPYQTSAIIWGFARAACRNRRSPDIQFGRVKGKTCDEMDLYELIMKVARGGQPILLKTY